MLGQLGAKLGYLWGKLKYTTRQLPLIKEYRQARDYWDYLDDTEEDDAYQEGYQDGYHDGVLHGYLIGPSTSASRRSRQETSS